MGRQYPPPVEPGVTPSPDKTIKHKYLPLLLHAGILILGACILFLLFYFKPPSTKGPVELPPVTPTVEQPANPTDEQQIIITLSDNAPLDYNFQYYPPVLYNAKINEGDIFTVTYSFSSNVDFDHLFAMFLDFTAEADGFNTPLSPVIRMAGSVKPNTEYSGVITIVANKSASSMDSKANSLNLSVHPVSFNQPPTLTFTKLEIVKNN